MESFFTYMSRDETRLPKQKSPSADDVKAMVQEYAPQASKYLRSTQTSSNGFWKATFRIPLDEVENVLGGMVDEWWISKSLARSIPGGFWADQKMIGLDSIEFTVIGRANSNAGFAF